MFKSSINAINVYIVYYIVCIAVVYVFSSVIVYIHPHRATGQGCYTEHGVTRMLVYTRVTSHPTELGDGVDIALIAEGASTLATYRRDEAF